MPDMDREGTIYNNCLDRRIQQTQNDYDDIAEQAKEIQTP